MPIKILDSFALMAFIQDETGADLVEKLILDAQHSKLELLMPVINLGEVFYNLSRAYSLEVAENLLQKISVLPINIVEINWELTYQAALYKARGNIAYADCFVAALAKARNCPVVTGDQEFKQLENEIKIEWLA